MPELPEVEVVRRGLDAHVVGRRVEGAALTGARVARRHLPGPADLVARVLGRRVLAADRRGKYLWLVLGGASSTDDTAESALVVHLGMSGQLLVRPPDAARERHLHATFEFVPGDGPGAPAVQVRFVDQRTFGGMLLADLGPDRARRTGAPDGHPHGIPEPVAHIAPDPLEAAFDEGRAIRVVAGGDRAVKRALLDQGLVSGIGNIYADEALWRAGIHGERRGSALTRPALTRLFGHVRDVMGEALGEGGTSFDALYVDVNGASGSGARNLNVYGLAGHPCKRCGTPIVRERFMNRSSHFCPVCQRKR